MELAYGLYMAEAENRFPAQRKASIEAAIKDFRTLKELNINPNLYIEEILARHNLKECQLSNSEIDYINHSVSNL